MWLCLLFYIIFPLCHGPGRTNWNSVWSQYHWKWMSVLFDDGSITFGWYFVDLIRQYVFRPITLHKFNFTAVLWYITLTLYVWYIWWIDSCIQFRFIFGNCLDDHDGLIFDDRNVFQINMYISVAVDLWTICYIILGCFTMRNSDWLWVFWM